MLWAGNGKQMSKSLKLIPLGGLGEIGKNMMLFEYDDQILVVDSGIMFPEHDMLGVDVVVPNSAYLEPPERRAGHCDDHGHEDHIGGLPYLIGNMLPVNTPIYGTQLTCGLIRTAPVGISAFEQRIAPARRTGQNIPGGASPG